MGISNHCDKCNRFYSELDEPCEECGKDVLLEEEEYPQPLDFNYDSQDILEEYEGEEGC